MNKWQANMAAMKINKPVFPPKPNAGAMNISSSGIVQPMSIQSRCFLCMTVGVVYEIIINANWCQLNKGSSYVAFILGNESL